MLRFIALLALTAFAAHAGVLGFVYNFSARKATKIATHPVVHPVKTAKALKHAAF